MVDGQQRVITVTCLTFSFTDPQIAKTVCNPILESVKFTP
jgi:hypothetical protein